MLLIIDVSIQRTNHFRHHRLGTELEHFVAHVDAVHHVIIPFHADRACGVARVFDNDCHITPI